MNENKIDQFLRAGCRTHLVGIGGVSMAPLAEVLRGLGVHVTGSDMREGAAVAHLRTLGIPVTIGHLAGSVKGADCVIRTAAVHDDNPEITAARSAGIPVFERAQAWGALMRRYRNALCVAGTHGKTTTTSMCTHIIMAAGMDPTVMIGGTLPLLGAGHRVGQGDTIIAESCEYCNSFLSFCPTVAVILNIEEDHLDFFKDLADIQRSFRAFAELVPAQGGTVIANGDDANTMEALADLDRDLVTFGLKGGDVSAANLSWKRGLPSFDVMRDGVRFAHVKLNVPGIHNVKNALAAAAHHPSEVAALLSAAESLGYQRILCAFQPHTYTRTKALFDDFVTVLRRPDVVLLAEIYAAREKNTIGISSQDLAARIPGSIYCPTLDEVTEQLRRLAGPGDLILTVGAGDIYTAGEKLLAEGE